MERFSIWIDNTSKSSEEIKLAIDTFNSNDSTTDSFGRTLINSVDFLSEIESININSTQSCKYQLIKVHMEKVNNSNSADPDDKKRIDQFICDGAIIEYDSRIYYLLLRGNTSLLKTNLRSILGHDVHQHNTLTQYDLIDNENDDFFYWIFNKTHNEKHTLINNDYQIKFLDLIGFKGKTENESTVSTSGSRILEILSTLAFIFENEQTLSVTTELSYSISQNQDSRITISLSQSGTHQIHENLYNGPRLVSLDSYETDFKVKHLIIQILCEYIFVIHPKLKAAFEEDVRTTIWSKAAKLTFIQTLGTDISDRVTVLANSIKNEIREMAEEPEESKGPKQQTLF